ncbi:DNA circularization protein [Bordetella petrii]|uniref:Tail/DNA circulation protein, putative n=1 Tax=Bordetella petrii (strain ATCC BAA-461 / DSM 12804 / CCUG 43448 / CIP 107267 / Se-1111R) TaxID=340100 RepID=A9ID75_BORPD|nr:DNA circularization N-terminal domain-containing protein [Bordetella petrii]CAP44774.1 tail/DNA circulation protein, putative [Bordetella petrii]
MTWRERIDPELQGSYRGVPFYVERADTKGGRRWLIHEYPRRDKPYSEDMGRRAKEWRLQLFVAGDNYDRERDALIEAFDAPGAATLEHPYLGSVMAVASDVGWSESTAEGGSCTFQVTFNEAGEESYPATTMDTQREVGQAANACETSILDDFAAKWNVDGLLGWSLEAVERDLTAVVRGIDDVVGGIADQVAGAIRFPVNVAGIVIGGYNRLKNAVMRPVNALDLYSGLNLLSGSDDDGGSNRVLLSPGTPVRAVRLLRDTGESAAAVPPPVADTPERRQRAQNAVAARQLNGRAAALTAARLVAETDWPSRQEAQAAGQDTLALIDAQMATEEPISDAVYGALVALRSAVTADLRARAVALPGLATYTPQVTQPALVVAHRLYGDARRADEIVIRNGVPHPGALRGGIELEVLSE